MQIFVVQYGAEHDCRIYGVYAGDLDDAIRALALREAANEVGTLLEHARLASG